MCAMIDQPSYTARLINVIEVLLPDLPERLNSGRQLAIGHFGTLPSKNLGASVGSSDTGGLSHLGRALGSYGTAMDGNVPPKALERPNSGLTVPCRMEEVIQSCRFV